MKIALTGGAGFIGSHLTQFFLSQGHEVHSIDNFSTGRKENIEGFLSNPNFRFEFGFSQDAVLMQKMIESCDVVFHLAASVGVKTIVEKPIHSIENNLDGTGLVLRLADKFQKRIFIFSTSEVYGKATKLPFEEDDDIVLGPYHRLRWSYAASKLIDDYLARAYFMEKGTAVTVVRLFNTIGQGQLGHYGMVVPRFFNQAISGNPLSVYGTGQQTRCFSDVRDVVSAINALISVKESYGELVNIGSAEELRIVDLAKLIKDVTQSKSELQFISFEEAYGQNFEDMDRRVPSCEKLKKLTGYELRYRINDTLTWIYAGLRTRTHQPSVVAHTL